MVGCFLSLQHKILPKRFDISSPLTGGCSEDVDAFVFFFKNISPSTRYFPHKGRYEISDGKIMKTALRKRSNVIYTMQFMVQIVLNNII